MFNTWGIRSVNRQTFNINSHDSLHMPRPLRNIVITALRIWNIVMNILGYIPGVRLISGSVRMLVGIAIMGFTAAIGDRNATSGAIIGRWYDEAINTGIAQVARGALEAFVPFGWAVNVALDVIATPINISKEMVQSHDYDDSDEEARFGFFPPHPDIIYPFPLGVLHLA